MSGPGDYRDDMELWRRNDEMDEQVIDDLLSGLAVPAALLPLADSLAQVRSLALGAPPQPSAALSAVLDGAAPSPILLADPLSARRSRRAARATVASGVAAVLALSSVGAAAAADRLPDGAQEFVAQVIEQLTPFEVAGSDAEQPSRTPLPADTEPLERPQPAPDTGVETDAVQPKAPSVEADVREDETESSDGDSPGGRTDADQDADSRPDATDDSEKTSEGVGSEESTDDPAVEDASDTDEPSSREEPGGSHAGSESTPDTADSAADPGDEDSTVSTETPDVTESESAT